ncbi:MAG TPA: Gfo/Idh/MocA family oxidoreductase [Membranihabitans sp.]|nr:Gfo/Idh/MocA family oxidoreductase [Membranihabitans sp.]
MVNRRNFIKASSSIAFGVPFLASKWQSKSPKQAKLGVALLGLGGYATGQLAPALQETEHCYLAGIVTGSPSKIPEWQQKYNIPDENVYNYENFDSIADNDAIDIVYVVTPNSLHMPFTIRAAEAGKHVICEKPMEISSDRCRKMIDACQKANKKLQIGYRLRYQAHHRQIMEYAKNETFGKVKVMDSNFSFYGVNGTNWRFTDSELSGGGPLMDIGIYSLEATLYGSGREPVAVTAQSFKTIPDKLPGMEESIFWQMEFPDGIVSNCGSSYVARSNYIHISTEKGWYRIEPAFSYGGLKGEVNGESMNIPNHNQQAAQMDAFAMNIRNDTPVIGSGEQGLQDMIYIEGIYEAAKSGTRVSF